jgi:hypothetical protein
MKRVLSVLLSILLALSFATPLVSCDRGDVHNRVFYQYFDTVTVIYDYTGGSKEEFDSVTRVIEQALSEYHKLYDI